MSDVEMDKAAKLKERSLSFDAPVLDATALDDLLDPRTPQEKERERLAVRVDSGRATFPVRSKDFRLLLLNWQGGGGDDCRCKIYYVTRSLFMKPRASRQRQVVGIFVKNRLS